MGEVLSSAFNTADGQADILVKRIARLGSEHYSAGEALAGYDELVRLLKPHLPPATVALFARPKPAEGGIVEWYSELGGQPVPFSQLSAAEAAAVKRLLDERLDSLQQLAARLETRGDDGRQQAALLRQAARYPDLGTLYSLNGQPVLTFWGYGLKTAEPPVMPASAAGLAEAAGAAPLPSAPLAEQAAAGVAGAPKKRRWWPWLLLLLLLGLLAAVLWWLFCREEEPVAPTQTSPAIEQPREEPPREEPAVEPPPVEEPPAAPAPEPPAEPEPQPEPEPAPPPPPPPDPLEELAKKVSATQDCNALQKMLTSEKQLQGKEPKAVALRQQISDTLNRNCKKQMIEQAKNLCPGQRPKELAPELIIVFDASGSMDFSLKASREDIQRAEQMLRQMGNAGPAGQLVGVLAGMATLEHLRREPKRITVAKQATGAVVQRIPRDVNIGMVMIERCPGARSAGYFTPGQRGSLMGQIQGIRPVEGTPLADGVARAGQMLDGVNKESVMLVVSDGEESCGQDPCAIARQLARSKPHLKINVVDIMGTGAGNCLAQATGGRVFTARNVNELAVMTTQAAQDVLGPANCKP